MKRCEKKSKQIIAVVLLIAMGIFAAACGREEAPSLVQVTITASEPEHSLIVGDSYKLEYKVDNGDTGLNNIKFESSDDKIAKVDSFGFIEGVAAGETTVTATYDGASSCTWKVKVYDKYAVNSTEDTVKLLLGESEKLEYSVSGGIPGNDMKVQFENDDDSVATLEDGVVTGLLAGETVITASYGDSQYAWTVKVGDPLEIKSDVKKLSIDVGKNKKTAKLYRLSGGFDDEKTPVVFSSSNEKVATVNDKGVITAQKEGKATITAAYGDSTVKWKIKTADYKKAYVKFIEKMEKTSKDNVTYQLVDVNDDNVPEILLENSHYYLYTFYNGKVRNVKLESGKPWEFIFSITDGIKCGEGILYERHGIWDPNGTLSIIERDITVYKLKGCKLVKQKRIKVLSEKSKKKYKKILKKMDQCEWVSDFASGMDVIKTLDKKYDKKILSASAKRNFESKLQELCGDGAHGVLGYNDMALYELRFFVQDINDDNYIDLIVTGCTGAGENPWFYYVFDGDWGYCCATGEGEPVGFFENGLYINDHWHIGAGERYYDDYFIEEYSEHFNIVNSNKGYHHFLEKIYWEDGYECEKENEEYFIRDSNGNKTTINKSKYDKYLKSKKCKDITWHEITAANIKKYLK